MNCFHCNLHFDSTRSFFTHLREHDKYINEFTCCFCDKKFSLFSSFKNHIYSHNKERVQLNTVRNTEEISVNIVNELFVNVENDSVCDISNPTINEDNFDIKVDCVGSQ